MFIYNVTIRIQGTIEEEWLKWLTEIHLPEVRGTGCFTGATVLKLLETDDTDGPTYAVQYRVESKALYNQYIEKYAAEMRRKTMEKWGDKFIAFRSLLQIVN